MKPGTKWGIAAALLAAVVLAAGMDTRARAAEPVTLKTTELGQGPTLVFLHDLGGGRMTWMPLARRLLGRYRVVLVDLPGHGDSPMPESFTLEAAAAALDRVLARQKAESTVVVGHGVGGVIALLEASAHPERQRGLVVMAAASKSPITIPDQQRDAFLKQLDEHYDDFVSMMFRSQGRDSAQGVSAHAQAALVPPVNMKAYLRELLSLDASAAARNLRVPMLFVCPDRSWPADQGWPEMAKKFGYDETKDVSWRRIGASGHYLAQDQPDSVATAIAEFDTRVLAGARKP